MSRLLPSVQFLAVVLDGQQDLIEAISEDLMCTLRSLLCVSWRISLSIS